MPASPPPVPALALFAAGVVVAAVALGTVLRLVDPLSSDVIPAEDPYTHMALVREHVRTGELDALNPGETLYPPGLHAFIATAWVYTGADLYGLMRFGPVVLGAIGILGIAVLLWRTAGPVAAAVGSLALAVAPEAIFRSTMMSPTALDLAILPFFLYALLRVLDGRLGWAGVAGPMAGFLAVAHPWLLAILCGAGVLFLATTLLLPWSVARVRPASLPGLAGCVAVLGCGLGLALLMPNFGATLGMASSDRLPRVGVAVIVAALLPSLALLRWRRRGRAEAWLARPAPGPWLRGAVSLALAAGLALTVMAAMRAGLPEFVDLRRMLGWPILGLAAAAFVAVPFIARPVASFSAALAATTLPFTLFNPMHSEFLSHRTVIFLGVALVALAGVAAGALAEAATALWAWTARRRRERSQAPAPASAPARRRWAAAVPALLAASLACGSVYAGTPDGYPGGWYRLYHECELDALRDLAAQADADPSLLLVTGSWQSKLVLAALTEDATRVWFDGAVFTSADRRDALLAQMDREGRPIVLVVERHLASETPDADLTFTGEAPWSPSGAWCANLGIPQPRVTAFSAGARVEAAQ